MQFKTFKLCEFLCNHLILKIEGKKQHFQNISISFKKGKNATETPVEIHAMYREGAVINQKCQ